MGDGYRRLVKVIGAIGNTFKDEWIIWAAYSIEAPGSCEEGAVTVPSNIILYQWDTVQNISSDIKKTSTVIMCAARCTRDAVKAGVSAALYDIYVLLSAVVVALVSFFKNKS